MKIKSAYKYQVLGFKNSVLVYYFVVFAVTFLQAGLIAITTRNGDTIVSTGGMSIASLIFIFIVGLCSHKENFLMLTQNGVSRKTQLLSWILSALSVSAVLAVVDNLVDFLLALANQDNANVYIDSFFGMIYGQSGFSGWMTSVLFCITMYLFAMTVGYFITIMFYRLNKAGKIIVGAGVPIFINIGYPIIEAYITGGAITRALGRFFDFALGLSSGQPYRAVLSFIVFSTVVLLFCWLLMRRSVVKQV